MAWPFLRIGNQTAFSAHHPDDPFRFAIEQGFDAFEWFNDKRHGWGWCQEDVDDYDREQIRQLGEKHSIVFSVHARCQANINTPQGRDDVLRSIEFAKDIGAVLVNVYYHGDQGPQGFAASLAPLVEAAAPANIRISVENTVFVSPHELNELFAALDATDWCRPGAVGVCFDMGHANLCAATRYDYVGFLNQLESNVPIIHLHVHENWGDGDSHLPLFTGPAAQDDSGVRTMLGILRERGYDGLIIMEQWPQPADQLITTRNRLRELLHAVS
ncbi:MAG: sugar phosphate isomerase/epimerase family protein [Thermogutta sp.]|nr:sugar phosphate isomerase/epimerase family protein [Thermogutta sp.]HOP76883.1 sugar phosphate isomerase/epimerase family protein [Thermogutta sp.]HPU05197.1 sugar phosphate isomerase/epimerase family protein [Thermogutta sp.]HPZ81938.1 sugar phosphate isomerase/epimerase family protein [Thermogutta sp.]HQF13551.1 sugar phosphate isomerase/epimerase family protein [Thermogutta sp.]